MVQCFPLSPHSNKVAGLIPGPLCLQRLSGELETLHCANSLFVLPRGPQMNWPTCPGCHAAFTHMAAGRRCSETAATPSEEFQSSMLKKKTKMKMGGKILLVNFCLPQDINKLLRLPVAELQWTQFIDEIMHSPEHRQSIMHQRASYLPTDTAHSTECFYC